NLEQLPRFMYPFFENVIDVAEDGHCGFRVVACRIGEHEDSHQMTRLDLTVELKKNGKRYIQVYGSDERYNHIMDALTPKRLGRTLDDKWMIMPDMGFLKAQ
ncbi:receptor-like protein kinase, partial [Trifolium medium]|nr:receptor-like protein kinase [Trifolium medium]